MSLTEANTFECPYCMVVNDIEVDLHNDLGQQQIVDCQICCAPIEVYVHDSGFGLQIIAKRDDE
ncbi:MAG: CPXCG motif-containing cysteine-rich protein [Alteromonadaceae bacterium]|nr:CPXCG motif-containing cysteine-rich protein [Alteromonadaceae bacterium]